MITENKDMITKDTSKNTSTNSSHYFNNNNNNNNNNDNDNDNDNGNDDNNNNKAHPPCIIAENCFQQQCIFIVKSLVLF